MCERLQYKLNWLIIIIHLKMIVLFYFAIISLTTYVKQSLLIVSSRQRTERTSSADLSCEIWFDELLFQLLAV